MHADGKIRDISLVNKSDDCLLPEYGVPACWWVPVLYKNRKQYNGYWAEKLGDCQIAVYQDSRDEGDERAPAAAHVAEPVVARA